MSFLDQFLYIFASIVGWEIGKFVIRIMMRSRYYTFVCSVDGCTFTAKSTDEYPVKELERIHNNYHRLWSTDA